MASNSNKPAHLAFMDELKDAESSGEELDLSNSNCEIHIQLEEEDVTDVLEDDLPNDIQKLPVFELCQDGQLLALSSSNQEDVFPIASSSPPTRDAQRLRRAPRGRCAKGRGGRAGHSGTSLGGGRRWLRGHATRAVVGGSEWREGGRVLEVCVRDEHVPQSLREMVEHTESTRRVTMMRDSWQGVSMDCDDDSEDDISGSDTAIARKLFGGDSAALKFEWSPMASFDGRAEEFQVKDPGPAIRVSKPYDAFRFYWNDDILKHIVRETNRYAEELKLSSARFAKEWYETNIHEIMILFAMWMMLGIIKMPSIKSCFSYNPLLKTDVFRRLITEARYWSLNRALSFVDNTTEGRNSSKLFLLGPVPDHLNSKFQEAYKLGQKITINESLMLWKGQLSFRQCIRTTAPSFGVKSFELCESATGYLWSFVIYTGKDYSAGPSELPKSTEIVVSLMKPLLNKGHQLFLGKWFNSPVLARFLKRNKTDCIGTLRKFRKNVPALIQLATLDPGTCIARHCGDVVTMVYRDLKPVYTISTCHSTESVPSGKAKRFKPAVIADYNTNMGGVDKKDQMLEPYLMERKKGQGWHKKMFKRLLNVSILNSVILLDKSSVEPVKQQAFRLELVDEIIEAHLKHVPKPHKNTRIIKNVDVSRVVPEEYRHFPARLEFEGETRTSGSNSRGRRKCRWCHRSKTVWKCDNCNVPLCVHSCFQEYHIIP